MALNLELVRKHLRAWLQGLKSNAVRDEEIKEDRLERVSYYQSYTAEKIRTMTIDDLYEYFGKLWAMLIWGNKRYAIDKLVEDNTLGKLRSELGQLIWGRGAIDKRWDQFRSSIKGVGPAMMSELLGHVHPQENILWNKRVYVGFAYLGVDDLPRYDYQLTGKRYAELCDVGKRIAEEMRKEGVADADLLLADYFVWDELQIEAASKGPTLFTFDAPEVEPKVARSSEFLHNEVRDKLADIGKWLGFSSRTEIKVADGSKVDAVWESTIGNMGRVIYVFEVQTKGSIDSLIINLLKSLNNPAVQGVVAVSDKQQLDTIRKHVAGVSALRDKLRYWDYSEVLHVHDALRSVNEAINSLGLVPQGF